MKFGLDVPWLKTWYQKSYVSCVIFSLRRGNLIQRSCQSVGRSVRHQFANFQKRDFDSINSNLSDMTKFILLDSLLQDVTETEIQVDEITHLHHAWYIVLGREKKYHQHIYIDGTSYERHLNSATCKILLCIQSITCCIEQLLHFLDVTSTENTTIHFNPQSQSPIPMPNPYPQSQTQY